jgi:hypothetical protein
LLSCSHVGLKYHAEFESKEKGQGVVVGEKSYSVRWLAMLCGGTFWAYGGACWLYYLYPTDDMTDEIRKTSLNTLASQVPDFKVKKEGLELNQWVFLYDQTQVLTGVDYTKFKQTELATSTGKSDKPDLTPKKDAVDITAFEQSIITKPTKSEILYTEKDGFPNGWPEKWYFETQQYKYWTVVGELKENQSSAMTSSAIKAQEILSKEFPLNSYKAIPKFETTHNQVKKIKGQYQSWRIVRVFHDEVVSLVR